MNQIVLGCVCALVIAVVSWRSQFLTPGGAAVQFGLGWMLLGLGGWQWTLPMLVFFLTSSVISRTTVNSGTTVREHFAKTGRRDAWQVLANGVVGGVLVIVWSVSAREVLYVGYLGAVAAAAADTLGTEIGVLSSRKPLLVTTFRPVEPGRSGAVSLLGIASGFSGALLVVLSGIAWIPVTSWWPAILSGVLGGMSGTLLDSLIGATMQAQHTCSRCGTITEKNVHCEEAAPLSRGFPWMQNDFVNFLCTLAGSIVGYASYIA